MKPHPRSGSTRSSAAVPPDIDQMSLDFSGATTEARTTPAPLPDHERPLTQAEEIAGVVLRAARGAEAPDVIPRLTSSRAEWERVYDVIQAWHGDRRREAMLALVHQASLDPMATELFAVILDRRPWLAPKRRWRGAASRSERFQMLAEVFTGVHEIPTAIVDEAVKNADDFQPQQVLDSGLLDTLASWGRWPSDEELDRLAEEASTGSQRHRVEVHRAAKLQDAFSHCRTARGAPEVLPSAGL